MIRRDFSRGWVANADEINGPKNALLRADNLVLDEEGVIALRRGSSRINTGDAYTGSDIHSLFTTYLGGSRYRMAGVADTVYANDVDLELFLPGNDDISFGAFMGQILMSRSTFHEKYNGGTTRLWGIAMSGNAPTLVALAADSKTFATCDSGESPAFTVEEGSKAFAADRTETADKAIELTPDSDTARGTITKTFAAATNFTIYDGTQVGTDADLIDFYAYLTEPDLVEEIVVMVDVNDGSFEEDFYFYKFERGDPIRIILEPEEIMRGNWDAFGSSEDDLWEHMERSRPVVDWVSPPFKGDAGWNHHTIARGKFSRIGSTAGKNWSTVKAIRLSVVAKSGGSGSAVRFDEIKILGGAERPLTGQYKYRYVYVYETSEYQGLSAPSAASTGIEVKANGVEVTVPADLSRDTQINKVWVYRMGGYLDQYYRVGVGDVSATEAVVVNDLLSDVDALIAFQPMEPDNAEPPDNIIAISEPHYDRIYCLTSDGFLHPSRRRNPDSFSAFQVIKIAGDAEIPYWISKAHGGLYIGTSYDIYRLDGTGAELPDGTIDFSIRPLNIGNPPISEALAVEGNFMFYLANDGWRFFNGESSRSIMKDVDLLYKGVDRHGVSAVNLTGPTARFRAAMADGVLTIITPEGVRTVYSTVLHRYDARKEVWYRHVYPFNWRSIHREPDGTLVGGDGYGYKYHLDKGISDHGSQIDIGLWTIADDHDRPDVRKDAWTIRLGIEAVGTGEVTLAYYKDGGISSGSSNFATGGAAQYFEDVSSKIGIYRQLQLRLTGGVQYFRFFDYELSHRDHPKTLYYAEPQPLKPSGRRRRFGGFNISIDTFGQDATVVPIVDGVAKTGLTINKSDSQSEAVTFLELTGFDCWPRITCATGFELYSMEPIILEELPQQWKGRLPNENFGHTGPKKITGIEFKVCTLGAARTFTPIFDNVPNGSLSWQMTTDTDEPATDIFPFTGIVEAEDIAFSVDGDIELYEWKALVQQNLPKGVKYWDNVPEIPTGHRRRFSGGLFRVNTGGNNVTVTPILDGVSQTALTLNTTDYNCQSLTFDTVIGRDLWFQLNASTEFQVMEVDAVIIEDYPPPTKGLTPRTNLDSEAIKVASGVEIKACTIGAARVITAVLDGVEDTTLSLTTSTNEHDTDTLQFSTLKEFTDIALKTDGDVEIFDWKPIVLYQMPRPRKIWDTGFVDLGLDDLAWIREVKIKCKTPGDLQITPYFDGVAFTAYTKTVTTDEQNKVTIFSVPIGRGYKGKQPRIVVQTVAGTEFHPFWVEFYYRPSGRVPSRKPMRVPA